MADIGNPRGTRVTDTIVGYETLLEAAESMTLPLPVHSERYVFLPVPNWLTACKQVKTAAQVVVTFSAPVPAGGGRVDWAIHYA